MDREAEEARRRAQETLRRAQQQGVEVHAIADALRVLRQRNHFGEMLLAAMKGRR